MTSSISIQDSTSFSNEPVDSQKNSTNKRTIKRTKHVCQNCFIAKTPCDSIKPCRRCIRINSLPCISRFSFNRGLKRKLLPNQNQDENLSSTGARYLIIISTQSQAIKQKQQQIESLCQSLEFIPSINEQRKKIIQLHQIVIDMSIKINESENIHIVKQSSFLEGYKKKNPSYSLLYQITKQQASQIVELDTFIAELATNNTQIGQFIGLQKSHINQIKSLITRLEQSVQFTEQSDDTHSEQEVIDLENMSSRNQTTKKARLTPPQPSQSMQDQTIGQLRQELTSQQAFINELKIQLREKADHIACQAQLIDRQNQELNHAAVTINSLFEERRAYNQRLHEKRQQQSSLMNAQRDTRSISRRTFSLPMPPFLQISNLPLPQGSRFSVQ